MPMIPKIRQLLGFLIAIILLFFLIKSLVQTHTQLKDSNFQVQWQGFLLSFCLILLYWSAYLYPFSTLLSSIAQKRIFFANAWLLFHLANITRYLPGRIWGFVRILSLSKRFGLDKSAVGGSLILQVGIQLVLGGIISLMLLFSKQVRTTIQQILGEFIEIPLGLLTSVGLCFTASIFLSLTLSAYVRQFLKALWDIGAPLFQKPFWHRWLNIFVSHILLWCCQGLAFFFFVKSLVPMEWVHIGVLIACYAFSWIVGFLSFLVPGGLGVREGLLSVLLSSYMSVFQATRVALFSRVWILSAEIILAGLAFFLNSRRGLDVSLSTSPREISMEIPDLVPKCNKKTEKV